jgi:hypothetical protein
MTQQELFDKVRALLKPAGYYMKLQGNWRFGHVLFNVRYFDIFSFAFTYNNLVEAVAENLANLKEIIEAEEIDEAVEEREFDFLHTLQAILETFPEEERTTVINYTFDQCLFNFLKDKLVADNIEVTFKANQEDDRHSQVFFHVKLPHLQFQVFPIYGRCFTPVGLAREVIMTGQDREYLVHGKTPEFDNALQAIEKRVQEYCEEQLLDEAKSLLADPESK